nr:MAG TPA: hypothetical protein [Caudoviricetes sp.]
MHNRFILFIFATCLVYKQRSKIRKSVVICKL